VGVGFGAAAGCAILQRLISHARHGSTAAPAAPPPPPPLPPTEPPPPLLLMPAAPPTPLPAAPAAPDAVELALPPAPCALLPPPAPAPDPSELPDPPEPDVSSTLPFAPVPSFGEVVTMSPPQPATTAHQSRQSAALRAKVFSDCLTMIFQCARAPGAQPTAGF
jgi:hypothetical protein